VSCCASCDTRAVALARLAVLLTSRLPSDAATAAATAAAAAQVATDIVTSQMAVPALQYHATSATASAATTGMGGGMPWAQRRAGAAAAAAAAAAVSIEVGKFTGPDPMGVSRHNTGVDTHRR
jgi:hypothetical protein